ncbi:hypothetical protein LV75_002130 [Actinokineospora diospyrosa]|uniref:Uncharacterized protein n=1 Tax=Actinokineospora diospyrosa TaxID=103728 RepID=A0ABT1IBA7_9PSEU|nr:hypothetical protein [Actinokineospora diospyrosa]
MRRGGGVDLGMLVRGGWQGGVWAEVVSLVIKSVLSTSSRWDRDQRGRRCRLGCDARPRHRCAWKRPCRGAESALPARMQTPLAQPRDHPTPSRDPPSRGVQQTGQQRGDKLARRATRRSNADTHRPSPAITPTPAETAHPSQGVQQTGQPRDDELVRRVARRSNADATRQPRDHPTSTLPQAKASSRPGNRVVTSRFAGLHTCGGARRHRQTRWTPIRPASSHYQRRLNPAPARGSGAQPPPSPGGGPRASLLGPTDSGS